MDTQDTTKSERERIRKSILQHTPPLFYSLGSRIDQVVHVSHASRATTLTVWRLSPPMRRHRLVSDETLTF